MILLDSSILIELFRKKDKRKTSFFKISGIHNDLCISSITYYEIGIGNRKSHFNFWNELSDNLFVLPFDKNCSKTAIEIYSDLLKLNKMIDIADIFIGATALTYKIPIATLNTKHFERIRKLEILK